MKTMTGREAVDRYEVTGACEECSSDILIVEKGGGVVSITCVECGFSASAQEEEVNSEWDQFLVAVAALEPHERKPFFQGAAFGAVRNILFFFGALLLNAVDGGGSRGLGR